jgi:predicted RNase H-like HicB family nuclease
MAYRFPDFPNAVAAARDQEDAMARAEEALAQAIEILADRNEALPDPTPFDQIVIPSGCKFVAVFAVRATPPDISERVNVYLPKSLLERVDRAAEAMDMSRSSFFRIAISLALRSPGAWIGYQKR